MIKKRGTTTEHKVIEWCDHTDECYACVTVENGKKGGRPKKKKRVGNPKVKKTWTKGDSAELLKIDFLEICSDYPPLTALKIRHNPNIDLCICKTCGNLLKKPIMNMKCQHVSCLDCLLSRVEGVELSSLKCIQCNESARPESYAKALTVERLLKNLRVECRRDCGELFTIDNDSSRREHEEFCFGKENLHPVEEVFKIDTSQEIPHIYEEAAVHILKNKMAQSTLPNKSIELKTGGPRVRTISR